MCDSRKALLGPADVLAVVLRVSTHQFALQTVGGTWESAHTLGRNGARRAGANVHTADHRHRLARAVRRTARRDALGCRLGCRWGCGYLDALLCLSGEVGGDARGVVDEPRGAAVAVDAAVLGSVALGAFRRAPLVTARALALRRVTVERDGVGMCAAVHREGATRGKTA